MYILEAPKVTENCMRSGTFPTGAVGRRVEADLEAGLAHGQRRDPGAHLVGLRLQDSIGQTLEG